MGFFTRLGSKIDNLIDQMIDWLGEIFRWFIESLTNALKKIWEKSIAPALYAAFEDARILSVIFYTYKLGETIMEIWDPYSYNTKPSQVFKLRQASKTTNPLPTQRSQAQVLSLDM